MSWLNKYEIYISFYGTYVANACVCERMPEIAAIFCRAKLRKPCAHVVLLPTATKHKYAGDEEARMIKGDGGKIARSDREWRELLTPEQYRVTREQGTERAFTGPFQNEKRAGTYACVCCDAPLFSSEAKFDSGTGWPSFFAPVLPDAVSAHDDRGWFMRRTEIRCARCDAHLGHVFPDGPPPTGLRYCMNGAALSFQPVNGNKS